MIVPIRVYGMETDSGSNPVPPVITADYLSGVVTSKSGNSENSIFINSKNYVLHKAALVQDDEGHSKYLRDLREGSWVRFHLDKGKIDHLVVILAK